MKYVFLSRLRRNLLLSSSSIALSIASSASALAQTDTAPPAPPAATAPQPSPSPAPATPPTAQGTEQGIEQGPVTPEQTPAPTAQSQEGAGNVLPETRVVAPAERPRPHTRPPQVVTTTPTPAPTAAQVLAKQTEVFDSARKSLFAPTGANPYEITQESIESKPQGAEAPLDKVLLQAPGVTQDSAAGGELHVRNEHANVQYRINGIALPDGVGSFGQIVDSGIVGSLALITGAMPAQFGLRTAGVVDIQTKQSAFDNTGTVSVYGGSRGTITPSVEYGGTVGQTQYYVSGRYFASDIGLENPTAANSAIHDHTDQGKGFAYVSTVIDPTTRLTFMSGVAGSRYEIPNNPGQTPAFAPFGVSNFNSANLNQIQNEFNQFNVLALQHSGDGFDVQTAYFNRTSIVHFMPDPIGDLVFNGVASDVYRQSVVNGIQTDASYRIADAHTLRAGFSVSAEQTLVNNASLLLPLDNPGQPINVFDSSSKTGFLFGTYLQDEWKITNQLTFNAGLRFDQMVQYVNANQLSPRISLTYTPFDGTVFHAGYARYFTPPQQVLAAPTNLALVQNTTQQPEVNRADPVLPERSHYFDAGVTHRLLPGLDVGVDAYYKIARNLLDDGQFGAAYVLTAFNYDRAENAGVEFTAKYKNGNFNAYGNIAVARQLATNVVSNQFLFAADELAFIANHYIYTDHAQLVSGSAGASYLWDGTRFSADLIYGSGLRSGFANTGSLPWYSQVNLGVSHEFKWSDGTKPTTLRFDVVNAFDTIYQIRDGSGIGVFAPQYGPRRGFFVGISQKL
jgi:outer membrane receptor protein involved in Fe transport